MDTLQHYDIIKKLDEGAYGEVLLAKNKKTQKDVAIKKIFKKFSSWKECMELKEVNSLRKLRHPNIVKLIEVLKDQDKLFLVFEFVHTNLYKLYLEFRSKVSSFHKEGKNA